MFLILVSEKRRINSAEAIDRREEAAAEEDSPAAAAGAPAGEADEAAAVDSDGWAAAAAAAAEKTLREPVRRPIPVTRRKAAADISENQERFCF